MKNLLLLVSLLISTFTLLAQAPSSYPTSTELSTLFQTANSNFSMIISQTSATNAPLRNWVKSINHQAKTYTPYMEAGSFDDKQFIFKTTDTDFSISNNDGVWTVDGEKRNSFPSHEILGFPINDIAPFPYEGVDWSIMMKNEKIDAQKIARFDCEYLPNRSKTPENLYVQQFIMGTNDRIYFHWIRDTIVNGVDEEYLRFSDNYGTTFHFITEGRKWRLFDYELGGLAPFGQQDRAINSTLAAEEVTGLPDGAELVSGYWYGHTYEVLSISYKGKKYRRCQSEINTALFAVELEGDQLGCTTDHGVFVYSFDADYDGEHYCLPQTATVQFFEPTKRKLLPLSVEF